MAKASTSSWMYHGDAGNFAFVQGDFFDPVQAVPALDKKEMPGAKFLVEMILVDQLRVIPQQQKRHRFPFTFGDGVGRQGGGQRHQFDGAGKAVLAQQRLQDIGDAHGQIGVGGQDLGLADDRARLRVEQDPIGEGSAGVDAQVERLRDVFSGCHADPVLVYFFSRAKRSFARLKM